MNAPRHAKARFVRHAVKLVGLLLLAWVLSSLDAKSLTRAVREADMGWLAAFVAGVMVCFVVRGIRYHYLLGTQGVFLRFGQSLLLHVQGTFWSMVTPARLGEAARAAMLARQGAEAEQACANVIIERAADVLSVLLLCLVGSAYLWVEVFWILALLSLAGLMGLLIGWWLAGRTGLEGKRVLGLDAAGLMRGIFRYPHPVFLFSTTLAQWLLYGAQYAFVAKALHLDLTAQQLYFSFAMATLAGMVPVSYFGIGTRDSMLVVLFSRFGSPAGDAVLFSASFLLAYVTILACSTPFLAIRPRGAGQGEAGKTR
jgi:hypothetical protein